MKNVVVILVVFAGAIALFYFFFQDDTDLCEADPVVCPCLRILQTNRTLGITLETGEDGLLRRVEFGGTVTREEDPSPELARVFVECIESVRPSVEFINFSRINTSPLGLVAHQWERATGMKITLRPRDEMQIEVLNNLQIGPDSGLRWHIMEDWCSGPMSACVECSDPNPDPDTVAVEVRLRDGAPVERHFWSDDWQTNVEQRPAWELVDAEGRRYLYECSPIQ